ncbi:hypothetical protein PO124_07700 [Bacillus licheniformis]|nr:hypothetical protein [Bacillus licheniformis]
MINGLNTVFALPTAEKRKKPWRSEYRNVVRGPKVGLSRMSIQMWL